MREHRPSQFISLGQHRSPLRLKTWAAHSSVKPLLKLREDNCDEPLLLTSERWLRGAEDWATSPLAALEQVRTCTLPDFICSEYRSQTVSGYYR